MEGDSASAEQWVGQMPMDPTLMGFDPSLTSDDQDTTMVHADGSGEAFESSITRCVCGRNFDNVGFMLQCEQCGVWQHGVCVGISQKNEPEQYFCELCRPDDDIHQQHSYGGQTPRKPLPNKIKPGKKGPKAKLSPTEYKMAPQKRGPKPGPNSKRRREEAAAAAELETTKLKKPRGAPLLSPTGLGSPLEQDGPYDPSKPMSREDRKMARLMETIAKMENQRGTKPGQDAFVSGSSVPPTSADFERSYSTPSRDPRSKLRSRTPATTSKGSQSTQRGGRYVQAQEKAPVKKPRGKPGRGRPALSAGSNSPSSKDYDIPEDRKAWIHRKLVPITPFYLGKKEFIMKEYREEMEKVKPYSDFPERAKAMSAFLPLNKILLLSHQQEHALQALPMSSSSSSPMQTQPSLLAAPFNSIAS